MKMEDFKKNQYYFIQYTHSGDSRYIGKCVEDGGKMIGLGIDVRKFYPPTIWHQSGYNARKATKREENWLNEAIKAGKYIEEPKFKQSPSLIIL